MRKQNNMAKKLFSVLVAAALLFAGLGAPVAAAGYEDLDPGVYNIDADLSCWVAAMGGVEFGAPMLTDTVLEVKADGSAEMTLSLQKSSVTIYGVTAFTFIDPTEPYLVSYLDGSDWLDADYTQSSDTAPNPDSVEIHYVDSLTFPLPEVSDVYELAVYINSNVMGVQFGGPSSNYHATLTVDWNSVSPIGGDPDPEDPDETSTQSSTVQYEVAGGYEVLIPAIITVDSASNIGEYTVEAGAFVIPETAYVTVTADTAGSITNGMQSLAFTNALESGSLTATGDTLDGAVTVVDAASLPGLYSGTLDFTINYYNA